MQYQQLLIEVVSRLTVPDFAAIFLGLVVAFFYTIHIIGGRSLGHSLHKLVSLALSIGLALILLAASIGIGRL